MPDYWWFEGESVKQLIDYLTSAENPRLEVRLDGATPPAMTFRVLGSKVVQVQQAVGPDINESHLCPPICPE